jgi:hypothetical protein
MESRGGRERWERDRREMGRVKKGERPREREKRERGRERETDRGRSRERLDLLGNQATSQHSEKAYQER